jgi:hypothetical protein
MKSALVLVAGLAAADAFSGLLGAGGDDMAGGAGGLSGLSGGISGISGGAGGLSGLSGLSGGGGLSGLSGMAGLSGAGGGLAGLSGAGGMSGLSGAGGGLSGLSGAGGGLSGLSGGGGGLSGLSGGGGMSGLSGGMSGMSGLGGNSLSGMSLEQMNAKLAALRGDMAQIRSQQQAIAGAHPGESFGTAKVAGVGTMPSSAAPAANAAAAATTTSSAPVSSMLQTKKINDDDGKDDDDDEEEEEEDEDEEDEDHVAPEDVASVMNALSTADDEGKSRIVEGLRQHYPDVVDNMRLIVRAKNEKRARQLARAEAEEGEEEEDEEENEGATADYDEEAQRAREAVSKAEAEAGQYAALQTSEGPADKDEDEAEEQDEDEDNAGNDDDVEEAESDLLISAPTTPSVVTDSAPPAAAMPIDDPLGPLAGPHAHAQPQQQHEEDAVVGVTRIPDMDQRTDHHHPALHSALSGSVPTVGDEAAAADDTPAEAGSLRRHRPAAWAAHDPTGAPTAAAPPAAFSGAVPGREDEAALEAALAESGMSGSVVETAASSRIAGGGAATGAATADASVVKAKEAAKGEGEEEEEDEDEDEEDGEEGEGEEEDEDEDEDEEEKEAAAAAAATAAPAAKEGAAEDDDEGDLDAGDVAHFAHEVSLAPQAERMRMVMMLRKRHPQYYSAVVRLLSTLSPSVPRSAPIAEVPAALRGKPMASPASVRTVARTSSSSSLIHGDAEDDEDAEEGLMGDDADEEEEREAEEERDVAPGAGNARSIFDADDRAEDFHDLLLSSSSSSSARKRLRIPVVDPRRVIGRNPEQISRYISRLMRGVIDTVPSLDDGLAIRKYLVEETAHILSQHDLAKSREAALKIRTAARNADLARVLNPEPTPKRFAPYTHASDYPSFGARDRFDPSPEKDIPSFVRDDWRAPDAGTHQPGGPGTGEVVADMAAGPKGTHSAGWRLTTGLKAPGFAHTPPESASLTKLDPRVRAAVPHADAHSWWRRRTGLAVTVRPRPRGGPGRARPGAKDSVDPVDGGGEDTSAAETAMRDTVMAGGTARAGMNWRFKTGLPEGEATRFTPDENVDDQARDRFPQRP